jgi:hypothetical protein
MKSGTNFQKQAALKRPSTTPENSARQSHRSASLTVNQEILNNSNAPETQAIYKRLIKLNASYIKRRNVPKSPRTFYTQDGQVTEAQKFLLSLEDRLDSRKTRRRRKQVQIEEEKKKRVEQGLEVEKKPIIVIKKQEVAEDIRQLRIATPPTNPNRAARTRGLKAYKGDRFGTRGDYSGGMLYLSRLALPDSSAAKQKQKKQIETVVVNPTIQVVEESDSDSDYDEFELVNMESKRKAASAIMELAKNPAIRSHVVEDGAIKATANLVGFADEHLRAITATVLLVLSQHPEYHARMVDDNAIEALVTLLESEIQQTTYMAAVSLANLACHPKTEIQIIEAGAVSSLQAIRTNHRETTDQLARLLLNLSCADDSLHSGGEEVIESVFNLANSETESIRDLCLRALCRMSFTPSNRFHLASTGAVRLVSDMMRFEQSPEAVMNYALVLYLLSADKHARHKMMDQNVVDICVKLSSWAIDNKVFAALSLSVATLANMALYAPCREHLFDEGAIVQVVEWAKIENADVQKSCAQTLQCMASDDDCVQRSVGEGALRALIGLCLSKIKSVVKTSCFSLAMLLSRAKASSVQFDELNEATALLLRLMAEFAEAIKAQEDEAKVKEESDEIRKNKSLGRRRHSSVISKSELATLTKVETEVEKTTGPTDAQMTIVCALALCNLSAQPECRDSLVVQGAPKVLIFLIHHGNGDTVNKCAKTMYFLSTNKANHRGLIDGGAVQLAIEVMRGHPVSDVVWYCGAMMFALAGEKNARNGIISEDGALSALLEMSNSGNADVRILCGAILCRLSSEVDRSEEIVQAGAIPSLITLSHWTHFETRQRCIVSISNLARGRLRARIIDEGAVPALIALSSSKDRKMRQDCASALCNLSCSAVSEFEMVKQGALSALVVLGLIRSGDEPTTRKTCGKALFNLLCSEDALEYAVEEDVIWALNEMCSMDEDTEEMFAVAACNLSKFEKSRRQLLRSGPIESLLSLITNGADDVKVAAGLALQNIICFATEDQLASMCSVELIRSIAQLSHLHDATTKEACASALCAFSVNKRCRSSFLDGGGLTAMIELAKIGSVLINGFCTAMLYGISAQEETRMKAVDMGAMKLLVQLSASSELATKEHCARILYMLVLSDDARETLAEKGAVKVTVGLAVMNSNPLIQSLCSRILCLLSCSPAAVLTMVEAGAVRILGVLAELRDERVRQDCVVALCNLSAHSNTSKMTNDGATHTLCELCDLRNVRSMERIAVVFRNLSCHQANARRMVDAGVVPTLVAMSTRGNPRTVDHALVAICNLSFEPTVRQTMAEEGAAHCVMRLSRGLDTIEAVQFCGLTISNLASDQAAHKILVEAGAISTLMEWLAKQTAPRNKRLSNAFEDQSNEADKILHFARHRIEVPKVEKSDLKEVKIALVQPEVSFTLRSLPWRKLSVQSTAHEPSAPRLPAVQRPIVTASSVSGANITDEDCSTDLADGMGVAENTYSRILITELDKVIMKNLKHRDSGTWAKNTKLKKVPKKEDRHGYDKEGRDSFQEQGKQENGFFGFDINDASDELVAHDETEPFPAPHHEVTPSPIVRRKKPDQKLESVMITRRPSSLPAAPNFVEHLDSLLEKTENMGREQSGKPQLW